MKDFPSYARACRERADSALRHSLDARADRFHPARAETLLEAMDYALFNGGKRVRPTLVYAAAAALDSPTADTYGADLDRLAAAVECIHAYSLVHDDLPAMDDDDLRRGKPSCHIAFGEAGAILAGDALQALAFELLGECETLAKPEFSRACIALAAGAGARGMAGGQALDLAAVDQSLDLPALEAMHSLKTGALIRASVELGAIAAGADEDQLLALDAYARAIGLAFQVQDDILDVTADTATLGKPQGADAAHNKPTYVSLLGLEDAREMAESLRQQARQALAGFGDGAEPLRQLADYIVARQS